MNSQRVWLDFHGMANLPHYVLIPRLRDVPSREAAVEKLIRLLGGFRKIPSYIPVLDLWMVSLELNIPCVV